MIRAFASIAAAAAMATAPIVAQAAPARTATPVSAESEQAFSSPMLYIFLFAAVIVLGLVIFDDDDEPISP